MTVMNPASWRRGCRGRRRTSEGEWHTANEPRRLTPGKGASFVKTHLKQLQQERDTLPKWDRNFGDLQVQVEQARATLTRGRHRTAEGESMPENTANSERAFQELVRVF